MRVTGTGLICRQAALSALLLVSCWLVVGCREERRSGTVVARVGKAELADTDVAVLGGKAYDSLSAAERWLIVDNWVEERLFELEGQKRGYDKDKEMLEQLAALRGALYRAKILRKEIQGTPTDSNIAAYYTEHRQEFLRPSDSYLLELYWGEKRAAVEGFPAEFAKGDSSKLRTGEIAAEGKWLAEHGELPEEMSRELFALSKGQFTKARAADDGFRVLRLVEIFPAGTVLDIEVVRPEIVERILVEARHARHDSLLSALKISWPVEVLLEQQK